MKRAFVVLGAAIALFALLRIGEAVQQCTFPWYSHSIQCLVNTTLTGEEVWL